MILGSAATSSLCTSRAGGRVIGVRRHRETAALQGPRPAVRTAGDVIHDLHAASAGAPIAATPPAPASRWSRRSVLALGTAGVIAIVGVIAILPEVRGDGRQAASGPAIVGTGGAVIDRRSIAVLPFADMSPNGDQAYFSDGITEEILNALARVPELRVPARTSSFAFKGRNVPVRDIARQLGVAVLLEGSVRKDGERVRITAQLIDAGTDRHLWSETFDRDVEDVFAVQTEIARTVTEALKVRLVDRVRPAPAPNARAHDLYLQGRFYWNRRSTGDLRRASQLFHDATRADSAYAPAYAGLAMTYAIPMSTTDAPTEAAFARAEEFARRAIALDSSLAEAHAALGYAYHWQWRWSEADESLRRATELDPANTTAHEWYGEHLVKMGRSHDAEAELRRAVVLDPLSPIVNHNLGLVLFIAGRYPDAIAQLERTSRMDPSLTITHLLLHRIYAFTRQVESSEVAGRRFAELQGLPNGDDYIALARATRGEPERTAAIAVLGRWERSRQPHWPEIAMYYAMFGERDKAIAALERGFRARAPMMTGLKFAAWVDPLRGDPRLERMIRAMRFP